MVTMHHFDLPHELQKLGGFTNLKIIDYFRQYANVLFEHFGDRVRYKIEIVTNYNMFRANFFLMVKR